MRFRVPVGARLLLTVAAISAAIAAPAVYAIRQLDDVRNVASELGGRHTDASRALAGLQALRTEMQRLQRVYVAAPSPELEAQLAGAFARARSHLDHLERAAPEIDFADLALSLDSVSQAAAGIRRLIQASRLEEATESLATMEPRYAAFDAALANAADQLDSSRQRRVDRAWGVSDAATRVVVAALAVGAALAFALAFWLTRSLALPLARLQAATARVASGRVDIASDVPDERGDEIGDLARSFRAMTERLAELDRVKAEFVGVTSYEIKGPIGLVAGYVDLLEEALQESPDTAKRCARLVEPIRAQTETLRQLANDLLELSRVSAGELRLDRERIRTETFAAGIAKSYRPVARRARIRFEVDVDLDAPAWFDADPDCIATDVIGTIVARALKSTPEGGSITIRFRSADDGLLLEIADTGIGMCEEQLPFVFEKYYRAGQRLRRIGSGLGLAIAREVVELHGGSIGVSSAIGHGTTFGIWLPLSQGTAARCIVDGGQPTPAFEPSRERALV